MPDLFSLTVLAAFGVGMSATLLLAHRVATPVTDVSSDARTAFDQMLLDKGILAGKQLDLIRHGTRSRGVVTGMRATGQIREDFRQVELDVMVSRPGGGQFAVREIVLIPASSMANVSPGCVIDTYYRPGDETAIAVSISPS
ncbi:hypothetical protein DVS77_26170 [Mycolicibacterium moriokaense]|nr:hypothetical protein DVS77_26170 [Mycolicibacterium moriokaense]